MRPGTLILGLGNPLRGDDGLGPRVVAELQRHRLPDGVAGEDGGVAGVGLLQYLEQWERVLIVDIAEMGRQPGEYVRFSPAEVRLGSKDDAYSVHGAGLAEARAEEFDVWVLGTGVKSG